MKNFAGKVAVITGAGSGIGRYLGILLARSGCQVALCDINPTALEETANMAKTYNVPVSTHQLDVADRQAILALPEIILNRHGQIDLVFNNAGITIDSDFSDLPEDDWNSVMDINLHGVVNMTRAFLPLLEERPEAALVNTSSIFGMVAVARQSVYHATKFAVRGFTEALVKEMKASSVQVHCVHPGHIGTNIAASAKVIATNKNQAPPLLGKKLSEEERGKAFRDHGMHPSRAAEIILSGVRKRRSRIFVGLDAKLIDLSQRIMPQHYEKLWPFIFLPALGLRNKKPVKGLPPAAKA